MLFDVWGSDALIHWAGWAMVFIGLIVLNEVGRRTKAARPSSLAWLRWP